MTMPSAIEPKTLAVAPPAQRSAHALKRILDVACTLVLFLPVTPILLVTAVVLLIVEGSPILFRQHRVGMHGRDFLLVKFRTMQVNQIPVEEVGLVGPDHVLVNRTGRVLRRLKIDELPQLLNVIRGEMSLVGPRPTIREQVDRYTPFQRRRLEVRPGVTGWSQVNGNASLTWADRIQLDVWYVDHWSLALDFRILLRTLWVVVRGERPVRLAVEVGRRHAQRHR
jgi:lipopolysaccharide/colanic/teichoic acid biosynthesis glycosyltransferase